MDTAELFHRGLKVAHLGADERGVAVQLAARVGRPDFFPDMVEQRHADLFFQLPHLHRDRRLREM